MNIYLQIAVEIDIENREAQSTQCTLLLFLLIKNVVRHGREKKSVKNPNFSLKE